MLSYSLSPPLCEHIKHIDISTRAKTLRQKQDQGYTKIRIMRNHGSSDMLSGLLGLLGLAS